jgi:hypothetical protein
MCLGKVYVKEVIKEIMVDFLSRYEPSNLLPLVSPTYNQDVSYALLQVLAFPRL